MAVIKDKFGIKLRCLRKSRGLSQEQLSELIGINQRQLTRIETGKSFPSFQTLENLCEVFGVEPRVLFDFRDLCSASESSIVNDENITDIVDKIKHLPPQKISFVKLALKALKRDKEAMLKMQSVLEGMLLLEN